MSDYMAAEIWIGGPVQHKDAKDLMTAIVRSAVSLDYGGPQYVPSNVDDLLSQSASSNGLLHLCDDQATWGQFDELETFLVKYGIAFDRQTEAKYEYNAELIQFRPGMTHPHRWLTTQDGEILIPREPVKRLVKELRPGSVISVSQSRMQRLLDVVGPLIPKLKPLKIVKRTVA